MVGTGTRRGSGLWTCSSFFFSSRRRHTRFDCDWSSDVCSSDLAGQGVAPDGGGAVPSERFRVIRAHAPASFVQLAQAELGLAVAVVGGRAQPDRKSVV